MTPVRQALRALLAPGPLIRLAIALAASVVLWIAISWWIGDRTSIA